MIFAHFYPHMNALINPPEKPSAKQIFH